MALTKAQLVANEQAIIAAAQAEILALTESGARSWSAGDQSVDNNGYIQALEQRIEAAQNRITKLWQGPYMIRSRKVV